MDKLVHETQPDNVLLSFRTSCRLVAQPYPKAISPHISDKAEHPQPSASQSVPQKPWKWEGSLPLARQSKAESWKSWLQATSLGLDPTEAAAGNKILRGSFRKGWQRPFKGQTFVRQRSWRQSWPKAMRNGNRHEDQAERLAVYPSPQEPQPV